MLNDFNVNYAFLQVTMATSSTPSILDNSAEKINGIKLMRLIVDGGTEALRKVFKGIHPGNLQAVLDINSHKTALANLTIGRSRKKVIQPNQWQLLYPAAPNQANLNDLDITLLCVLLRNICGLSPPPLGWDDEPDAADESTEADIVRIKRFRNERFGHIPNTNVSATDFKSYWAEISSPLGRLGLDQAEIDRLENEVCGDEEVPRVLKEWDKCENEMMEVLHSIDHKVEALDHKVKTIDHKVETIVEKQDQLGAHTALNKHLVSCDFEKEIGLYNQKFTHGTREWVFEQFSTWLNDKTSSNRVFVITGVAGMGKSVIAAVICRRFAEHIGACHFCQYNNTQYNNPQFLLQSLASQLSKVFPEYQKILVDTLSGNLGQSLNAMNVEGLFSVLFKEPFSRIPDAGKLVLIVIDAVDESTYDGRQDLGNLISHHFHKLPFYIRFVITTRPEENLMQKFEKLSPLYIKANDERNSTDVKLVIEERISTTCPLSAELVDNLAKVADGHMLYAFFLSEIYKENPSTAFHINDLPKGIAMLYENYFKRLEGELANLGISEDGFLSFLSALAVAKEPLPVDFVEILFGFGGKSPSTRRKVTRAVSSLSTLLVIAEDQSISFFHKSLTDWLVDKSRHDYSVDVQDAHSCLFDVCVKQLGGLKKHDVQGYNTDKRCFQIFIEIQLTTSAGCRYR